MTYEDKIIKGGEILTQGMFNSEGNVIYIMPIPKNEDVSNIAILNVKLSQNEDVTDYPFVAGIWNPVAVNSINVRNTDLTNYRIFWGSSL